MQSQEFKNLFGNVAMEYGFEKSFGGWFKDSPECIAVLDLQKSNYGNYYQLNIKIFIQGMFGRIYVTNKDLIKREIGHVRSDETLEFKNVFDLDKAFNGGVREQELTRLFREHVVPFTDKSLSIIGINELGVKSDIILTPAVKEGLVRLNSSMT